ncbi:RING finger and transmembrane domain-containing protein 2-like isoform X3 [Zootermopsis nevadensis]|uniref:RING finger and transmembrane domain-containing protein 2-like isoform X3 n=1 Tax=Zootermopsis nevadensis TaxID=136037 RepID=UPI000B8E699A|nr:RING finger and transmembrane domain-containing protein 2-like isoform X3 [Zootermopsis nevadensis]
MTTLSMMMLKTSLVWILTLSYQALSLTRLMILSRMRIEWCKNQVTHWLLHLNVNLMLHHSKTSAHKRVEVESRKLLGRWLKMSHPSPLGRDILGVLCLISTCLIHHLFILGNKKVKLEIANGSQRSLSSLILIVCLYGCIPFIFSSHPNQELSMESKALDLPDLKCCHILCDIALRDVIIKCSTVALKASVAAIPAGWLRYESRGEWYLLLEAISQMYRSVAPIQPWLNILSIYAKEYEYFAVIVYIIIKGMMLYPALRLLVVALWILLRNQGICMMANPDQVQNAGSSCSVCRPHTI